MCERRRDVVGRSSSLAVLRMTTGRAPETQSRTRMPDVVPLVDVLVQVTEVIEVEVIEVQISRFMCPAYLSNR